MPNYQKTLIYKLICNDANIMQFYVGHTTNFNERKRCHKKSCCNEKNKQYNQNKYQFIRDNGGWNNWNMIEIEKFPCNDKKEALIREKYWINELKATLNTNIPGRTKKEWNNENRDKIIEKAKEYYKNNSDKINKRNKEYCKNNREKINKYYNKYYHSNSDKINERNKKIINCECGCAIRKDSLSKHLKSQKHIDLIANKN